MYMSVCVHMISTFSDAIYYAFLETKRSCAVVISFYYH